MKKSISSCGMLSECWRQTGGVWAGWKEVRGQGCEVAAGRSARKTGSVGMCVGFLLAAGAKKRGNGGASVPTVGDSRAKGQEWRRTPVANYRRSRYLAQRTDRITDAPGFPRSALSASSPAALLARRATSNRPCSSTPACRRRVALPKTPRAQPARTRPAPSSSSAGASRRRRGRSP